MAYRPSSLHFPSFSTKFHPYFYRLEPQPAEAIIINTGFKPKLANIVFAILDFLEEQQFEITPLETLKALPLDPSFNLNNGPAVLEKIQTVFRTFLDNLKKTFSHESFSQMQDLLNYLHFSGCSFLDTLEHLKKINSESNQDPKKKERSLEFLTHQLISQNRFAEAAEVAVYSSHKDFLLKQISEGLMTKSQISDALYIAQSIVNPGIRNQTLYHLGLSLIQDGQIPAGINILSSLDTPSQSQALKTAVERFLQDYKIQKALDVTLVITSSILKDEILQRVALFLLECDNDSDRAILIGQQIENEEIKSSLFEKIALSCSPKENLKNTLAVIRAIPLVAYKDSALSHLCCLLTERNCPVEAKGVFLLISSRFIKDSSLKEILLILLKKRDLDNALAFFNFVSVEGKFSVLKETLNLLIEEGYLTEAACFIKLIPPGKVKGLIFQEIPLLKPTHLRFKIFSFAFWNCLKSPEPAPNAKEVG